MRTYLSNRRVYFSSPIEYSKDESWRPKVMKTLREKFELDVFDPTEDQKQQWLPELLEAKSNKDWATVRKIARSFCRKDLSQVDRSDILIAYLPYKTPTTGTHHEIINSVNAKKPVILVTEYHDISGISAWYFAFVNYNYMCCSWEQLFSLLERVNNGEFKDDYRWAWIYDLI